MISLLFSSYLCTYYHVYCSLSKFLYICTRFYVSNPPPYPNTFDFWFFKKPSPSPHILLICTYFILSIFFYIKYLLLLFMFTTISTISLQKTIHYFFYIPTHMSRLGVQKRVPQASNQSYSFPLPTHEIQNHTPHLTNISTQFQVARANYLIIFILSIIYPKIIVNRSFFHSFLKINWRKPISWVIYN